MRYVVGLVLFFATAFFFFSWVSFDSRDVIMFLDLATLIMLLLPICATLVISGEFGTLIKSKNALISKKYYLSNEDRVRAISLYKVLAKVVVATTIIMVVSSLIVMLRTLDDPAFIGPVLAIAFISVIYGAVLLVIFIYPAQLILKNRVNIGETRVISEKEVINKLLELCYRNNISPEEVMDADDISFKKQ